MQNNLVEKIGRYKRILISKNISFLAVASSGLLLRFYISSFGHNIDLDAFFNNHYYSIQSFGEPWSSGHYNYGFAWGYYSFLLNVLSGHEFHVFRILIILSLGIVDILIAWQVRKRYGNIYLLVLFNPVTVLITGYHNQFDNVAILLGILALQKYEYQSLKIQKHLPYILLMSASLVVKHDLIFFAFWIIFRNFYSFKRILLAACPVLIFLISFAPFVSAYQQIWLHVFRYKSFNNGPLYYIVFLKQDLSSYFFVLFLCLIVFAGLMLRNADLYDSFWLYLILFVALSSSIANQYLAVAALGLICLTKYFSVPFLSYCFFLIINHPDGPELGFGTFLDEFAAKYVYLPIPVILLGTLIAFYAFRFSHQKISTIHPNKRS